MLRGRLLTRALAVLAIGAVSACSLLGAPAPEPARAGVDDSVDDDSVSGGYDGTGDDWVVVIYAVDDGGFDPMLELLDTEMAADAALYEAGAGWIDGNDIGSESYDLYFMGDDADVMWAVLEPVLAEAPVAWTAVELRDGLTDPDPTILTNG